MEYSTIKSEDQYDLYCKRLCELCEQENPERNEDEMEVIDNLIEEWDEVHYKIPLTDSVQLLLALMDNHSLSLNDIVNITGLTTATVTQMLNYEIEIPEEGIKKLAKRFCMFEEAFANRRNS